MAGITGTTLDMLEPRLEVLPSSQRLLWSTLGSTPSDFVLYGGTALALRLAHRESADFDFFSNRLFEPLELLRSIPYLKNQTVTQQAESTLSCDIATAAGIVKVSFFGGLSLRQIMVPDLANDNRLAVASLLDLFGTKCVTVTQRNEIKDYLDIHALLTRTDIELSQGIAAARAIYGTQYDPLMTLQALSYFDDLREPLDGAMRTMLLGAVRRVSLGSLPMISAMSSIERGAADA